jgi:hypothetical protein
MQGDRLPKRFPVGTKYIVEGKSRGEGQVQVFSRYLVFPDGQCINLPADPIDFAPHLARRVSSAKTH